MPTSKQPPWYRRAEIVLQVTQWHQAVDEIEVLAHGTDDNYDLRKMTSFQVTNEWSPLDCQLFTHELVRVLELVLSRQWRRFPNLGGVVLPATGSDDQRPV